MIAVFLPGAAKGGILDSVQQFYGVAIRVAFLQKKEDAMATHYAPKSLEIQRRQYDFTRLFFITLILALVVVTGYGIYAYQRIGQSDPTIETPLTPVRLDKGDTPTN